MNNFFHYTLDYQISDTESIKIQDEWDKDKERLYLKATILNTDPNPDDYYRVSFINKYRRYWHFSDTIPPNHFIQTWLDVPELRDEDKFSDVRIYISKNDHILTMINYRTPRLSDLRQRFTECKFEFDGEHIFNNINKSPIFICGTPGGGTSYMAKMLKYCGLFIGDDVCRLEDRKTFESSAITMLQFYFVRQILGEKEYYDPMNIYWLVGAESNPRDDIGSLKFHEWISKGLGAVDLDELEVFKREFLNILPLFWGNNSLDLKWGFKKPFNMIWLNYFVSLFPDSKVLIIDKKKEGKMENRSYEGKRFEKMNESEYKLFTEIGDDLKCNNRKCDFNKINKDVNYFNKIMGWCGLPPKTKEEHYQMLVDLKYDMVHLNLNSHQRLSGCQDKDRFGYTVMYEERFADLQETATAVVEIGVREGDSIKMWERYFTKAIIYGFDWASPVEGGMHYIDKLNKLEGIEIIVGDQDKKEDIDNFLVKTNTKFDIIIDDGSHMMSHQQLNMFWLWDSLKVGGWYVIEDIHTSFRGRGFEVEPDGGNTTHRLMETFKETSKLNSVYFDGSLLEDSMEVDFLNRDICFIKKTK
jgi:hypothetical protein